MLNTTRTINTAGVNGVSVTDDFLSIDTLNSGGEVTMLLPSIDELANFTQRGSGYNADTYNFKFSDIGGNASINNIVIKAKGTDTINGAASVTLNTNGASGIVSVSGNGTWVFNMGISNAADLPYSINITYTGVPQVPIAIPFSPPLTVVQPIAIVGDKTYYSSDGVAIGAFSYTEGNVTFGDRLSTISFNDLVTIQGTFSIANCSLMTSIDFPELKYIGTNIFSLSGMALLTNISLPELELSQSQVGFTLNPLVTSISLPLAYSIQTLAFNTMAGLTSINAPLLKYSNVSITTCGALTTFTFPVLEVATGSMGVNTNALLTSFNFPVLKSILGGLQVQNNNTLTSIDFPSLEFIGGTTQLIYAASNLTVTSLTMPNLKSINTLGGLLQISNMTSITTLSFPLLETMGTSVVSYSFTGLTALTTFSMPAIINCLGTQISTAGLTNLMNLTIGTVGITKSLVNQIIFIGCKLTLVSVESILAVLVSLDGTGGTTLWGAGKLLNLSGGTSAGVASLSPTGAANRLTLIGRGAAISMNP